MDPRPGADLASRVNSVPYSGYACRMLRSGVSLYFLTFAIGEPATWSYSEARRRVSVAQFV